MKLFAFMKYGAKAASTRQRLLQYVPALEAAGIEVEWHPLIASERIGRSKGLAHLPATAAAYAGRAAQFAAARRADLIWVHKELFPFAPGVVEASVTRIGPPVVYDMDDAIFHNYDLHRQGAVRSLLGGRFETMLSRAAAASCGNAYLRDYAARFCRVAEVIPTTLDTDIYRPATDAGARPVPVIGWIGSPTTWPYMAPLVPMLEELVRAGRATVRIVGSGADPARFPHFTLVDWREDREVEEIQRMDIGVMPLTDDPWSRGKCGYKLIQYMACGLPVVASPVGVNGDMVRGENGRLATTPEEWRAALDELIGDPALRRRMGTAGRQVAERDYSLAAHAPRLVALLRRAAGS